MKNKKPFEFSKGDGIEFATMPGNVFWLFVYYIWYNNSQEWGKHIL